MTPGVVKGLEVIDVEQQQRKRFFAASLRFCHRVQDAFVEELAVVDLGERIERGLAAHVIKIALQFLDVLTRGREFLLEFVVGVLHAAGFAKQAPRHQPQGIGIEIFGQVAAGRLQRARIGVRRRHGAVDGVVHLADAIEHPLGDARDALAGVA